MLKYESQKIRQKDKIDSGAQRFNVETLKREKTTDEHIFTIDSGYTTQTELQHSSECIIHAGLLASAITHTAMASLTHSLSVSLALT